jgi:hypothetical protein
MIAPDAGPDEMDGAWQDGFGIVVILAAWPTVCCE